VSAQEKQNLRVQIQGQRAKISETELLSSDVGIASQDWGNLITGEKVACYSSWGAEPGTSKLRRKLVELGKQVFLPVVTSDTQMLWGIDQPPYVENRFGISEPSVSNFELGSADAIILPALCADEFGSRLGRGAGYFDRALSGITPHEMGGPIRIALLFDNEVLPSVPRDEHDELVDLLVTPTQIIRCKK